MESLVNNPSTGILNFNPFNASNAVFAGVFVESISTFKNFPLTGTLEVVLYAVQFIEVVFESTLKKDSVC